MEIRCTLRVTAYDDLNKGWAHTVHSSTQTVFINANRLPDDIQDAIRMFRRVAIEQAGHEMLRNGEELPANHVLLVEMSHEEPEHLKTNLRSQAW
jgi:hypothetical protein